MCSKVEVESCHAGDGVAAIARLACNFICFQGTYVGA